MSRVSALGVLRLRAQALCHGLDSAKRFAQDDGFVGVLKKHLNRLALMGRSPPNAFAIRRKDSGQEQEFFRIE